MLNTNQHNPNMDDAKRMTLEQFVRNNRGINEGEDLPLQFLEELYFEIKHNEIQMKKSAEANDFDGLLVERANMTAPFFSSSNTASKFTQAGVHERDMFVAISSTATKALSAVFVQSWDDSLVVKALNGLRSSANICAYFGLTNKLDEIMDLLLSWGQDYLDSVSKLQYMGSAMSNDVDETVLPCSDDELGIDQLNASLVKRDLPPLPTSFVTSLNGSDSNQSIANDVIGSAAHRGLLSLQAGLSLCKSHLSSIDEALPMLIEVIFALRDVDALPPRLTDLDDFADAQGNALRASKFADNAFKRLNAYKNSLSTTPKSSSNSGLLSMFSFGTSSKESEALDRSNPLITVLNAVSNNASLDQIIMKMSDVSLAKRVFSSMLSAAIVPEDDAMIQDLFADPTYEHNAVFVLELAARLLISNRSHSAELMPIFVSKLETMFSPLGDNSDDSLALKFPYLLERIIVTILRAAIHLYDIPDSGLRIHITRSIEMILTLPCSYIKEISSRLGCGSAIGELMEHYCLSMDHICLTCVIQCCVDVSFSSRPGKNGPQFEICLIPLLSTMRDGPSCLTGSPV
jgi:brefeldin A-resistance guanine nucleotide exchange factor 1